MCLGEGLGLSISPLWGSCPAFSVPLIERGNTVAIQVVFLGKQRKWLDLEREGWWSPVVAQLAILFEHDLISCRLPWLSQGAFVDPGRCWFGSVSFSVCISLQERGFIMGQEEELKCSHLSAWLWLTFFCQDIRAAHTPLGRKHFCAGAPVNISGPEPDFYIQHGFPLFCLWPVLFNQVNLIPTF